MFLGEARRAVNGDNCLAGTGLPARPRSSRLLSGRNGIDPEAKMMAKGRSMFANGGLRHGQPPWQSVTELATNMLTSANCDTESSASAFASPAASSVRVATR